MLLSQLPVGSLVKDTNTIYNNDVIIFRILEHGHDSDPTGTTTLECRDILTLKCFDAAEPNNNDSNRSLYGNNRYAYSNILQWLNSNENTWYNAKHSCDAPPISNNVAEKNGIRVNPYNDEAGFLTNFSNELKNALSTVGKTTALNTVTDGGGSETVSSKLFLLSLKEVGLGNANGISEGSVYEYYNTSDSTARRIKNLANSAAKGNVTWKYSSEPAYTWWLRSPNWGQSHAVFFVRESGSSGNNNASMGDYGISPAFCIPSSTMVSDSPDGNGVYTLIFSNLKIYKGNTGNTTEITIKKLYTGYGGTTKAVKKLYGRNASGKTILIYPLTKSLEESTWAEISQISNAGKASQYYKLGDTKSIRIQGLVGTKSYNVTINVVIIGFDHNSNLEGRGISFGCFLYGGQFTALVDDYNGQFSLTDGQKAFNIYHWYKRGNSYGGWKGSDIRYDILGSTNQAPSGYGGDIESSRVGYDATSTTATSPVPNTLMAALPSDLRAVMKPITKYSDNSGNKDSSASAISASVDYLPLVSECEMYGSSNYENSNAASYTSQYDYFKNGFSQYSVAAYPSSSTSYGITSAYLRNPYINDVRYWTRCVSLPPRSGAREQGSTGSFGLVSVFLV